MKSSNDTVYASTDRTVTVDQKSVFNNKMIEIQRIVDKNLKIDTINRNIYLSNESEVLSFIRQNMVYFKERFSNELDLLNQIKEGIAHLNTLSHKPGYYITQDLTVKKYTPRSVDQVIVTEHWWGVKYEAPSDEIARDLARHYEIAAHNLRGIGVVTGVVGKFIPPFWIAAAVAGGQSWYFSGIVSSIRYNASLPGNGVILDLNRLLFYSCYPR